jgi:type IV pilus assembly protein PilM
MELMSWFPFKVKKTPKNFLGIDIGTSFIRIVELSKKGQIVRLENYGEIKISSFREAPFRVIEKDALLLSNQETAIAISAILKEAGIQSKEVNFSIPDFSSFFTNFELPPMDEGELPGAIKYEARSYIPLPLSEVTLDWSVVEGQPRNKLRTPLKILVVAIPNEVVNRYQEIASLVGLQMKVLEAEVFALSRSSLKNDKKMIAVIDIGARSTTCNVFEKGNLKISHSFNISGNNLTEILSRSLGTNYEKAEELKKALGLTLLKGPERNIREILLPLIDAILSETKKIFQNLYQQEGKEIEKIVLAGGTAWLPGLKEYFFSELKKEVEIANPFSGMSFSPVLEGTLKEMGPAWAIAVGLTERGLE